MQSFWGLIWEKGFPNWLLRAMLPVTLGLDRDLISEEKKCPIAAFICTQKNCVYRPHRPEMKASSCQTGQHVSNNLFG